jgi:hypothetical protein
MSLDSYVTISQITLKLNNTGIATKKVGTNTNPQIFNLKMAAPKV